MPASLTGIHHVTCITGDVQKNVDFYVSVLGLRFVKKSINQDVPDTYHLYFADYVGSPGTAMTFFGWPHLPKHVAGRGQVTTVSFALPEGSIDFWSERLRNLRVDSRRASRFDGEMILLLDPDGIQLELVESKPHSPFVPWKDGPVDEAHAIHGFYSVTLTVTEALKTVELLQKTMGFKQTKQEGNRTRFETGPRGQGSIADVIESPEAPVGEEGTGTVHHVAWRAKDEGLQQEWRSGLIQAGRNVTPVIDRYYFKSIYFREPGGVLFEIATDGPGFTIDESPEELGSNLSLPPWFQVRRDRLDANLTPIVVPTNLIQGRASSR